MILITRELRAVIANKELTRSLIVKERKGWRMESVLLPASFDDSSVEDCTGEEQGKSNVVVIEKFPDWNSLHLVRQRWAACLFFAQRTQRWAVVCQLLIVGVDRLDGESNRLRSRVAASRLIAMQATSMAIN